MSESKSLMMRKTPSPRRCSTTSTTSRSSTSGRSDTSVRYNPQASLPSSRRTSQSSARKLPIGRASSPVYGQPFWDSVYKSINTAGYTVIGQVHGWVAPDVDCDGQNWDNIRKAYRRKDSKYVILRRMAKDRGVCADEIFIPVQEEQVMRYLDQPAIRSHPHNRTVGLVDIFTAASVLVSSRIMVLKPSGISSDSYFKQDLCKSAEQWYYYIEQVFEGFAFLHEHEIAYLDITLNNILINSATLKVTLIDFETVVKGPGIHDESPKRGKTPLEDDVKLLARLFLQRLLQMRERFPLPFFDELLKDMFENPKPSGTPRLRN